MPIAAAGQGTTQTGWPVVLESWAESVVAREASQAVIARGPVARAVRLPFKATGIIVRYRRDHGWRQTGEFLRSAVADRLAARR